jgi:hypothetical protein
LSKSWRDMMEANRLPKCQKFRNGLHEVFFKIKYRRNWGKNLRQSSFISGSYSWTKFIKKRHFRSPIF